MSKKNINELFITDEVRDYIKNINNLIKSGNTVSTEALSVSLYRVHIYSSSLKTSIMYSKLDMSNLPFFQIKKSSPSNNIFSRYLLFKMISGNRLLL